MNKKRIWGIVQLVVGVMATFGATANGTFEKMAQGVALSDIVMILCMIALIVVGIILIIIGKSNKVHKK